MEDKKTNTTAFSIKYYGEISKEALKFASESSTCSVIFCEKGTLSLGSYGGRRTLSSGGRAVIIYENGISLKPSAELIGRIFVFSGSAVLELFKYYLRGRNYEIFSARYKSSADTVLYLREAENNAFTPTLFDIHRMLFGLFSEDEQYNGQSRSAVSAIKEYIDSNVNKKLTLDELSRLFFISKTQIYRLFKSEYGIAPMTYMLLKKTEAAKLMLASDGMKVSRIAEALCFTDAKHFSKTFKNFTGMLPAEYKKSLKSLKPDNE